ncbi:MAG: hypothetical protein Q7S03_01945 [bacterium]|nr:hypothetical protein [bacterium]
MPAENKEKSTLKTESSPVEVSLVREMKVLFSWKSAERPFKKRDREFWTTVLSIVFLVGVILFFIKEWLLIGVIIALVFVYYVLSTVPPGEVEHQITNRGIRFAGKDYLWEEIGRFWFSERLGQKVLIFELRKGLVSRLELLLGGADQKRIKEILLKYLPEETPNPTFLDQASAWLTRKVPLEIKK